MSISEPHFKKMRLLLLVSCVQLFVDAAIVREVDSRGNIWPSPATVWQDFGNEAKKVGQRVGNDAKKLVRTVGKEVKIIEPPPRPRESTTPEPSLTDKCFGSIGSWAKPDGVSVSLGPGNVPHSISAVIEWPNQEAFVAPRQWILLLGQNWTGAHHWLWSPPNPPGRNQIGVWNGKQSQKSLPVKPNAKWRLTVTHDGSTMVVYVDGAIHETVSGVAFNFAGATQTCKISPATYLNNAPFAGKVYDLCIWNRALKFAEVQSLLPTPAPATEPPCDEDGH